MKEYTKTVRDYGTMYYKDKERTIIHREDGPAIEWSNGNGYWYLNDNIHRMDGPAIETTKGNRGWYINGKHIFTVDVKGKLIRKMK